MGINLSFTSILQSVSLFSVSLSLQERQLPPELATCTLRIASHPNTKVVSDSMNVNKLLLFPVQDFS